MAAIMCLGALVVLGPHLNRCRIATTRLCTVTMLGHNRGVSLLLLDTGLC